MRTTTADYAYGERGPEEIALESWLEDSGPYMSLSESDPGTRDEPEEE